MKVGLNEYDIRALFITFGIFAAYSALDQLGRVFGSEVVFVTAHGLHALGES